MKKIVALALSLVMVLGLATTAFGATTSTGSVVTNSVTAKNPAMYELASVGGSMEKMDATVTDIEKTTVTGKIVDDVAMYVPTVYEVDGVLFIEVAKASAQYALKNNGAYVYLAVSDYATVTATIDGYATDVEMDKIVAPVEVPSCGDEANSLPYYVSGKDVYYVGGSDWAYFKGEFVAYDADTAVEFVPHTWKASKVTYRGVDALGHQIPVAIKCAECEKTFDVVGAAKFDNTWVKGVNYDTDAVVNGYFIVLDAATAAAGSAATGETVESAKTFDAGIAMYVGMSVMAAAGSAVVLKKKD